METKVATLLEELDGGGFIAAVGVAMSAVAGNVCSFDKKGHVILKFTFEQIGNTKQVTCKHTLSYDHPTPTGKSSEESTGETPLHVGQGGELTLFPANQIDLFKQNRNDKEKAPK